MFRIFLQETYEIEDCNYYNSGTITSSQTLNVPNLPVNFKATFKVKKTASSMVASWLNIGTDANNLIFFGQAGANYLGVYKKVSGSNTNMGGQNVLSSLNTDYLIEFTYEDGALTLKCNNATITGNYTFTGRNFVSTNIEANNSMKELKIKAL